MLITIEPRQPKRFEKNTNIDAPLEPGPVLGHLPLVGSELVAVLARRRAALLANALDVWLGQRRDALRPLLGRQLVGLGLGLAPLSIVATWSWSVPCGLKAGRSASLGVGPPPLAAGGCSCPR